MASAARARYKVGQSFELSGEALDNYGEEYRGRVFKVSGVFDHYAPPSTMASDATGHPGFDESAGSCLYEADDLPFAVYDWEMLRA